jgi:hypothetical protein
LVKVDRDIVSNAIDLVLDEEISELAQLWKENEEDYPIWKAYLVDIKSVLV